MLGHSAVNCADTIILRLTNPKHTEAVFTNIRPIHISPPCVVAASVVAHTNRNGSKHHR